MLAGHKVCGLSLDLKGGTAPLWASGEIAEEPEEPPSARELGIQQVGGGGHGGNYAGREIGRALGRKGKIVVAVVVRACEPLLVALVN